MLSVLASFWDEVFESVSCSEMTSIYLKNVLEHPKTLKNNSITIEYAQALEAFDFQKLQQIGDWTIVALSFRFEKQHSKLFEMTGSRCYRLCNDLSLLQWDVYSELSQNISVISHDIRVSMKNMVSKHTRDC